MMIIPIKMLAYMYLISSIITAILFAMDKQLAITRSHRIPEKSLFLASILFGWPGAIIAMKLFRHKTAKISFIVGMGFAITINIALITIVNIYFGN